MAQGGGRSGLERFRAATCEDIVGVFRDAVEGRITVDGKRASHDLLIQLAGKDGERIPMSDDSIQVQSLLEKGMSWPDVFRQLLSQMHPKARTYVHLTSELLRSCRLHPDLMNQLQRWNYWFGEEGYDDQELERIIEGKISLKE